MPRILNNTYIYRLSGKTKQKKNKFKSQRLNKYANQLNLNIPKSEIWFRELLLKEQDITIEFQYNIPLGNYIPDAINMKHRIIIEVDGTFHDSETQKFKDRMKDLYYFKRNFRVFRIKAYDINSYNEAINIIKLIIKKLIV